MATLKKNSLDQILFVAVDKTDGLSVESALTASQMTAAGTRKFYGVNHGGSAAVTSGAISKVLSVVHSGIFRATLKAAETNYDQLLIRIAHPSMADQVLLYELVDSDDSDILSALTVIQSIASDAASAAQQANSRVLLNQSRISDIQSFLSDFMSDFQSRVPKAVATNSQLSDLHSDLRSFLVVLSGVQSDMYSLLSDTNSNLLSLLVTTGIALDASAMSDLRSAIAGVTATVSASDISDIASAVQGILSDTLSNILSAAVQASSRILVVQSRVSDVESALDSQFVYVSNVLSDLQSVVTVTGVQLNASSLSDLRSAIAGVTATLGASDISDIASAVQGILSDTLSNILSAAVQTNSRVLLNQSRISDIQSFLSDFSSDFQSRVPKLVATNSQLSDLQSDLRSLLAVMSGIGSDTYSLLSDLQSDFQSRVPKRVATDSQLSDLHSDLRSYLLTMSGVLSDVHSGVQLLQSAFIGHTGSTASQVTDTSTMEIDGIDHDSQFNGYYVKILGGSQVDELRLIVDTRLTPSHIVVKPAFNSRLASGVDFVIVVGNPYQSKIHSDLMSRMSDVGSDLRSYLAGMSDILSDVFALVSDLQSDFQSRVPKLVATNSQLSDLHSDLRSFLVVASGVESNIYSLLSDFESNFGSRIPKEPSARSQVSGVHSDLRSFLAVMSGVGSDTYSLLSDLQSDFQSRVPKRVATDSQLSDVHSDLASKIGGLTLALNASDISDIASAVQLILSDTLSNILSAAQQTNSRALIIQSLVSDVDSALTSRFSNLESLVTTTGVQLNASTLSDLRSAIAGVTATLSASDISDIASAVQIILSDTLSNVLSAAQQGASRALVVQSRVSDVESALDSQFAYMSNALSDLQSVLTVTGIQLNASSLSDLRSAIAGITATLSASDISDIASAVHLVLSDALSNILSAAQQGSSRTLVVQSRVSDIESALDSQFVYISNVISDMHSDLASKVGGVSVTLTASDISDIASAVAAAVTTITASDISDIASAVRAALVSDLSDILSATQQANSRALAIQSLTSDIDSALTSRFSNLESLLTTTGVQLNASSLSDLRSAIVAGGAATITASDISDIASAIRATLVSDLSDILSAAQQTNSRTLVIQSRVSDVESALDSQFAYLSNTLSDFQSDFQSRIPGALTASDVASRVWGEKYTAASNVKASTFGSALRLNMSRISDLHSLVSDVHSDLKSYLVGMSGALSDIESQLDVTDGVLSDFRSDFQSRVPKLVATSSQVSDLHSDVRSYLVGISGSLSDVESQLDVTDATLSDLKSDFQSRVPKLVATGSQLSDLHSDLRSYMAGLSGALSDVESQLDATDLALSDLKSDFQSRVPKRIATDSQLSDALSNLSARIPATLSSGRMRVDVEALGGSAAAATNLRQASLGIVTGLAIAGTLSATQMSTDLTGYDNDELNNRLLTFLTGNNAGSQVEVTDFSSAGVITFTALGQAVSVGDSFFVS